MDDVLKLIFQNQIEGIPIKVEQYSDDSFLVTSIQQEDDVGKSVRDGSIHIAGMFSAAGEKVTYEAEVLSDLYNVFINIGLSEFSAQNCVQIIKDKLA